MPRRDETGPPTGKNLNCSDLEKLYWGQKLSIRGIAKLKGVSRHAIKNAFSRFRIPCRTHNEAIKLSTPRGKSHPRWREGHKYSCGYILVLLSTSDFFRPMANKDGYVREHRLVMAQYLKRCLLPWEVVHHKNGIRSDNRIENLELVGCKGKHNTLLHKQIKQQAKFIKELQRKVFLLECELELLRTQIDKKGDIKCQSETELVPQ